MSNLFCGIIPSQILSNSELSQTEKLIFGIISGFNHNNKSCTASNATIAAAIGVTAGRASKAINKLVEFNLLTSEISDNSNRKLFVNLDFSTLEGVVKNDKGDSQKRLPNK